VHHDWQRQGHAQSPSTLAVSKMKYTHGDLLTPQFLRSASNRHL